MNDDAQTLVVGPAQRELEAPVGMEVVAPPLGTA
jgi:hypothetical protein